MDAQGLEPKASRPMACPPRGPKVRAAVNMWVDGAVLRPDAVDKPIWMNDPHWALVAHLKQFVYAFQETILNACPRVPARQLQACHGAGQLRAGDDRLGPGQGDDPGRR
jgi:hypothetical protein